MKNLFLLFLFFYFFFLPNQVFSQMSQSNEVITRVGSPSASTGGSGQNPGSFVYFCQSDPKWTAICGLGYAGCGPTSMAMVLSTFGDPITPPEMDKVFQSRGWRQCSPDAVSYMTTAIETLLPEKGYTVRQLTWQQPLDLNKAKEYILNKYLIIGSVYAHIFVVDGVNPANNTIHMQDPARKGCENPGGYDASNSAPWGGQGWYYAYAVKKTTP